MHVFFSTSVIINPFFPPLSHWLPPPTNSPSLTLISVPLSHSSSLSLSLSLSLSHPLPTEILRIHSIRFNKCVHLGNLYPVKRKHFLTPESYLVPSSCQFPHPRLNILLNSVIMD
jgi:hypothetical protein